METNTNAAAIELPATPPLPAKAKTNVYVEIMEGITLSALLILFSFLYMFGAMVMLNPTA